MSTAQGINTDLLSAFVAESARKKAIEESLENSKRLLAEMEQSILDQFSESGVNSVKVDGTTIYMQKNTWASARDGNQDAVCSALRSMGYESLVKTAVNAQALSSLIRDFEREGGIPDDLRQVINVTEKFSIRTRNS